MKKKNLNNKVIVVTGGCNGIGKATAELLFERGANVVIADIEVNKQSEIKNCGLAGSQQLFKIHLDAAYVESWNNLYESVLKEFGKIDVLINCAGILSPGNITDTTIKEIERQIAINLLGPIYGTKVFMQYFNRVKKGHVINISSLAGITPIPGESIYSASKFGLRGFSLSLSYEMRNTNVKVTVVCPDSVLTDLIIYEAKHNGSNLSFSGKLLKAEYVAGIIYKTILHPKNEVLIKPLKGLLSKAAGNSSLIMGSLYSIVDKIGEINKKKLLAKLNNEAQSC